jgi:hypothetical protein
MPDFSDVQTSRIQYLSIVACVGLIVLIIELIRRGRLREEHSFIWLGAAIVFLAMSIWRGAFDALARFLGIAYAPALLILVVLFFGFIYLLYFSVTVSRLTSENKRLAQEVAILTQLIEEPHPKDGTDTQTD